MRRLFHPSMKMCISSFATSAVRALPMLRPTPPTRTPPPSFRIYYHGQYERPLRVLALNVDEGWSRDVSEAIAAKVRDVAEHEGRELTSGTLAFIEDHIGRALQPTLPLW